MNEEWFLQLTLDELQVVYAMCQDAEIQNSGLGKKVADAIDRAMTWHTPMSEVVGTPSRGELP